MGLLLAANGAGLGSEPSQVVVWTYNYARIDSEALAGAKTEAARILNRAGVEVRWVACPMAAAEVDRYPACSGLPEPVGLVLRIRPAAPAAALVGRPQVFGYALLPKDGGFGTYADVYAGGADLLTKGNESLHTAILGHLMAHELGHLLLGTASHSAAGIMHVPWSGAELGFAAQGRLLFAKIEAERMRANLLARMRHRRSAVDPFSAQSLHPLAPRAVVPAALRYTTTIRRIGDPHARQVYAGPDGGGIPGLDQVNVLLPTELRGRGAVGLMLTADGEESNTVAIDQR